jgi:hypothetical protein
VTAIDMRRRLGMAPRTDGRPSMAVGIELKGESYGLLIDSVGEVLKLADNTREPNPVNLDLHLARVSAGVHRLERVSSCPPRSSTWWKAASCRSRAVSASTASAAWCRSSRAPLPRH